MPCYLKIPTLNTALVRRGLQDITTEVPIIGYRHGNPETTYFVLTETPQLMTTEDAMAKLARQYNGEWSRT